MWNTTEILNTDDNGDPIIIPFIPPYPGSFNGQFIQMDVISGTPH